MYILLYGYIDEIYIKLHSITWHVLESKYIDEILQFGIELRNNARHVLESSIVARQCFYVLESDRVSYVAWHILGSNYSLVWAWAKSRV